MAQAILGGAAVRLVTPQWATISHAALGQLFFVLLVSICVALYGGPHQFSRVAYAQHDLRGGAFCTDDAGGGCTVQAVSPAAHIAGAVVATGLVMWAGLRS